MESFWHWHGQGGPLAVALLSLVFAAALVLLVLWVALPFALFGTKRLLRDLVARHEETNRRLEDLGHKLEEVRKEVRRSGGGRPPGSDWLRD